MYLAAIIVDHEISIEVEMKEVSATCPRCGNISHNLHQNHWHLIRDLSFSNKDVFLKINRRQFKCHCCKKPFSEQLHFVEKRKKWLFPICPFYCSTINQ